MDTYIDVSALGQALLWSFLFGAGIVAVFSVGLVGLSRHEGALEGAGDTRGGDAAGLALAVACGAVVVAAIALGVWTVVS